MFSLVVSVVALVVGRTIWDTVRGPKRSKSRRSWRWERLQEVERRHLEMFPEHPPASRPLYLHEAMRDVLSTMPGQTGTAEAISEAIEKRNLYHPVPSAQIVAVAAAHDRVFENLGDSTIKLK